MRAEYVSTTTNDWARKTSYIPLMEPQPSVIVLKTKNVSLKKAYGRISNFIEHNTAAYEYATENYEAISKDTKISEEVLEKLTIVKMAMEESMNEEDMHLSIEKKRQYINIKQEEREGEIKRKKIKKEKSNK
jgi:hypothetical protein